MAFNPIQLLKMKDLLNSFRRRHPGVSGFIDAVRAEGLPEGSVLDLKITFPEGKSMATNIRVSDEDIELIRAISQLRGE